MQREEPQDVPGLSQPIGNVVDAMAERLGLHAVVGCDATPGKGDEAKTLLPATVSLIDKSVQKGVITKNTARRYKSRLAQSVNAIPR